MLYRVIAAVVALVLPLALASAPWGSWEYEKHKKTTKCYQCAYSPGKTVYKEEKVAVEIKQRDPHHWNKYVTKTEYKTRLIPVKKPGGWDKCQGPFNYDQGKEYGVDVWDCKDNCYTRIDRHGNVLRGCYKGEFGVNPNKYGCNVQAGQLYCFCKGDKCNNKAVPSGSNVNFDDHDSWGAGKSYHW